MRYIIELPEYDYKALKEEGVENHLALANILIAHSIPVSNESDLISRSELKQIINKIVDEEIGIDEKWAKGLKYSLKIIDNASAVETYTPEPVKELVDLSAIQ